MSRMFGLLAAMAVIGAAADLPPSTSPTPDRPLPPYSPPGSWSYDGRPLLPPRQKTAADLAAIEAAEAKRERRRLRNLLRAGGAS